MRMLMLGAASIALAASAVHADPGKGGGGHGGGHGNGGGPAAATVPGGGGHGHGDGASKGGGGNGGGNRHADHARAEAPQMRSVAHGNAKAEHGKDQAADRKADRTAARAEHGQAKAHAQDQGHSAHDRAPVREVRAERDRRVDHGGGDTRVVRTVALIDDGPRGLIDGCPPGLAKKNNGCMPPGLAQQRDAASYRPSWFGYPSYNDGRYYYDDGYLYRTSNTGSILGYIPLLGGALSVGNPWPSYYQPAPVPDYYVDYYNLGSPDSYRYADDVLYRVDPQSDAITSIAALLTGDRFAVGQPMPAGYDIYNVPYAYRDQYYDTPEADYRYADGYIYQVDPTTQLIQAAIQLLT